MALSINQNATALLAYSNLNNVNGSLSKSIAKLSSGLRINSAADDAAGLAISEKMRSQIIGLNRAKLNVQDGMSMLQVAEGGLNETENIIQRMRELAIQASNDTLTSNDRLEIQKEINQLRDSINDIAHSTEYNTKKLLNGNQTAQISASSKYVSGVVTGSGSKAGDYRVSMSVVEAGISQVQATQIFF
jgi:flagellin